MFKLLSCKSAGAKVSGLTRLSFAMASIFATSVSFSQALPPSSGSLLQTIPAPKPVQQSQSIDLLDERLQNTKAMTDVEGMKIEIKSFKITGLTVISPDQLVPVVNKFVGPNKKFQDLLDASAAIRRELARRGYFLADAVIPKQKIENGVVEILVVEGRIGKVRVQFDKDVVINQSLVMSYLSTLQTGAVITAKDVERALFLISDLRGISARSVFVPGEKIGSADLVVRVSKTKGYDGSLDFDTNGSQYTGLFRGGVTYNINNPFHRGDLISVNYLKSLDGGLHALSIGGDLVNTGDQDYRRITYLTPIGELGSKLGISYSQLHYQLGTPTFDPVAASGDATVASFMAVQPIVRSRNANFMITYQYDDRKFHDAQMAYGYVADKETKVYSLAYSGDLRDSAFGGGINVGNFVVTSGGLDIKQPDIRLSDHTSGLNSQGSYKKVNFTYSRLQQLNRSSALYYSYTQQAASKNMDSSEKISLGGPGGVRAYPQGEGSGDEGYVSTVELRYSLPKSDTLAGDRTFVVFYDFAWSRNNKDSSSQNPSVDTSLKGIGAGLNWDTQGWSMKSSLAWRQTQPATSESYSPSPRVYFQLSKKL